MSFPFRKLLIAAMVVLPSLALAQLPAPEYFRVTPGLANAQNLQWQGKSGRTYFLQHSTDLQKWQFVPLIELGDGDQINLGMASTAQSQFYRLVYTDQPTDYPDYEDFDGDGLISYSEIYDYGTHPLKRDSDGDGLPDGWEVNYGLDPNDNGSINQNNGANGDEDLDGLNNLLEYQNQGTPTTGDSDGDGLEDFEELYQYGTKLDDEDTDGDRLYDGEEVDSTGTDPLLFDTDGDWMGDSWELNHSFNPLNPADGMSDADGDGLTNKIEYAYLDRGYDAFSSNSTAGFPWNEDPDNDGLTTAQEYNTYQTNPRQHDTDGDTMSDDWEILSNYSPLKHNSRDNDPTNNATSDPDSDGMNNSAEATHGTNPHTQDSDGDGVPDQQEILQGSNPNDPNNSTPAPHGTVPIDITFGDNSGSHSEKYTVILTPAEGDTQKRQRTNRDYGEVQTDTCFLPKGARYTVTIEHAGTSEEYRELGAGADYDYTLEIPQLDVNQKTLRIVKDPVGIFGQHDESEPFFAQGQSAELFVMHIQTETDSPVPLNQRDRKLLGVREVVNLKVTPATVGSISWSLTNTKDASLLFSIGDTNVFEADTRNHVTTTRIEFTTGDYFDIQWHVIEPTGEIADFLSPFAFAPGKQGVGMNLKYTTLPNSVSFTRVEVLEVDKGTSNIHGFFEDVPPHPHLPTATWTQLKYDNVWFDKAWFQDYGRPGHWESGTFQFDIEVRWRTIGESGQGEVLSNRVQLHTILDNTGRSSISKSGQSTERSP